MTTYLNIDGDSGVEAYEFGAVYIDVRFKGTPRIYRYSYQGAGREEVEKMKELAKIGTGLHSFIDKYAKYLYEK